MKHETRFEKQGLLNTILWCNTITLLVLIIGAVYIFVNSPSQPSPTTAVDVNELAMNDAELSNALSLLSSAATLPRTAANDKLLRDARDFVCGKPDYSNAALAEDINVKQRRLVEWKTSTTSSVSVAVGDRVSIRNIYGGMLYYDASALSAGGQNDIKAAGQYKGDISLFIVEGAGAPYFAFKNVATNEYLDSYGGELHLYSHIDKWSKWTLTTTACTDDGAATMYRMHYARLKTADDFCPFVNSFACEHHAVSSAESCSYCNAEFQFEKFN